MADKKKIKIDLTDFWLTPEQNKMDRKIVKILSQYYDVEISDEPDFLFYSCDGMAHKEYKKCVKIFYTEENVIPDFNECDYASGFDYIEFGDRYLRKLMSNINKGICNRSKVDESYFDRKFCNFIYSNTTSGEGAVLRQQFCQKLMKYKPIDCPGKVLNNMSATDLAPRRGQESWEKSKLEFLKKYKFTIAFENSSSNGYTTEKLVQPLQSFSIPIYYGNPFVTRDFNPKAFINCNDYDNDLDAVIERVKELDNDPDKYLAMLRENPMQPDFDFDQGKKYEQWLVNIIEKGNKPFNKDPRGWGSVAQMERKLKEAKLQISELSRNQIKETSTTARIDVFCDYQDNIFSIDNQTPTDWMRKANHLGYVLQQDGNKMDKQIKINQDISLTICLRGPDKRDKDNTPIPVWVDFTSLTINGNEILSRVTPVWHNRPFNYTIKLQKGDVVNLHAEWVKHQD